MRRVLRSATTRAFRPLVAASANHVQVPLVVGHSTTTRCVSPLAAVQRRSLSSLVKTSKDGVVGHPIDFDVNSKIEGNESQIVTINLEPGQVLRAESGAMMYMTQGVEMNTTTG